MSARVIHDLPGGGYDGGEYVTVTEYRFADKPDIFVIQGDCSRESIALDRAQIQALFDLSRP